MTPRLAPLMMTEQITPQRVSRTAGAGVELAKACRSVSLHHTELSIVRCLIAITALVLCSAGPVQAQSITAGALTGAIRDAAGAPLHGALLTLTEDATGLERSAETDDDGRFGFELLPPGSYTLLAEILGYRPQRIHGIAVTPGRPITVTARLWEAEPPVVDIAEENAPSMAELSRAGVARWFAPFAFTRLPESGFNLSWLNDEVEGLPSRFAGFATDGVPYTGPRHPWISLPASEAAALPLAQYDRAEIVTGDVDVERSEFAGHVLQGYSRRGTSGLSFRAFGDWAGDATTSSSFVTDAPAASSMRGALVLSGPVIADTAQFVVGVAAQRVDQVLSSPWLDEHEDIRAVAAATYGVDLDPYIEPRVQRTETLNGFGRFDWQAADRHHLSVRGSAASFRALDPVGFGSGAKGLDITVGATLSSAFGRVVSQELRAGFERGQREWTGEGIPFTTVVQDAVSFGGHPALPGDFERTALRLTETVHLNLGAHRFKLGIGGVLASHDQTFAWGRTGERYFGNADAITDGQGVLVQAVGPLPQASFNTHQLAFFIQDAWHLAPGFEFKTGLRYEMEFLPAGKVTLNQEWAERTELLNTELARRRGKLSPRAGFRWGLGENEVWVVRGQAGIFYDMVEPAVLAELITHAGRVEVERRVGDLTDDVTAAPRLTLLGPDYEAPRSSRAGFGITRRLGATGAVHVSTSYRHTDFLPRRVDLNRLPAATWRDQHGRPVYGGLVQVGTLVAADPETNRRFDDFEMVSALNPDGYSDYWDVAVALERTVGRSLNFMASYTHSGTTDNWLSGRMGGFEAQFNPFPDGLDERDWADGRSDYDVPHRLTLGVFMFPLGRPGFSVALLYRYRSGYPFTPGFRDGVDVNGDGSGRNDPAFVDEGIAGVTELLDEWECLRLDSGRFVTRNACREPALSTLDLRLGLGPFRLGGYPVELVADFLNVTDAERPVVDRALYLVDPDAGITTDENTGRVTLPLVANENFGQALGRMAQGRVLRIGFRVNY